MFFLIFKKKEKKRKNISEDNRLSIYCSYGALREEQEVKRILIGTTHKSSYKKQENRNTKLESRRGLSCRFFFNLKLNGKRMIYREMDVYFYSICSLASMTPQHATRGLS